MFIQISKNKNIVIHQGDTVNFSYEIKDESFQKYILGVNEYILFSVYEPNQEFIEGVIRKKLTKESLDEDNNVLIKITHEDTHTLQRGTYYYDIKLATTNVEDGSLETFRTLETGRKFIIL